MKQENKRQQSRDAIIQAGVLEFSEHGYDEASTNGICQKCGISKGRLYYYFETKGDLYIACAEWVYEQVENYCFTPDPLAKSVEEKFHSMLVARQCYLSVHPHIKKLVWQIMQNPPPSLQPRLIEIRHQLMEHITDKLRGILHESGIINESQVALCSEIFLIATNHTHYKAQMKWVPGKGPVAEVSDAEQRRQFDELVHAFLYGVLPR